MHVPQSGFQLTIGGRFRHQQNVISGNVESGIRNEGFSTNVWGNLIGAGTDDDNLGNGRHGVEVTFGRALIGPVGRFGSANRIRGNAMAGVRRSEAGSRTRPSSPTASSRRRRAVTYRATARSPPPMRCECSRLRSAAKRVCRASATRTGTAARRRPMRFERCGRRWIRTSCSPARAARSSRRLSLAAPPAARPGAARAARSVSRTPRAPSR